MSFLFSINRVLVYKVNASSPFSAAVSRSIFTSLEAIMPELRQPSSSDELTKELIIHSMVDIIDFTSASFPLGIDQTNVSPQPAGSQSETEQSSSPAADTVTASAIGARCQKNESSPRLLQSLKIGLLNARSIENKSSTVADIITEGLHDVFLITETWHTSAEDTLYAGACHQAICASKPHVRPGTSP